MQVQSLGREDPLEEGTRPTPVFLPGEAPGQRSLAGYGPQGPKKSDTPTAAWHPCRLKFNLLSLFLVLILDMYSELYNIFNFI